MLPFTNLIPIRFKKLHTTRTGRHSARLRPSAGFFSSFRSECTAEAQDTSWLCFCRRGALLRWREASPRRSRRPDSILSLGVPSATKPSNHQQPPAEATLSAIQHSADGSTTFKFNKKRDCTPMQPLNVIDTVFR